MSIERFNHAGRQPRLLHLTGLLASVLLAGVQSRGQDFNERFAAWQSGGAMRGGAMQPQIVPPSPPPEAAVATQTAPAASARASGRLLSEVYSAPMHSPDFNQPWTQGQCASCSHGPTFVPPSDQLGTCDYVGGYGGGPNCCCPGLCGGCGSCGPCGGKGGGHDWGPLCCNPMVWLKTDVLLWWRQGRDFPQLVTSDPVVESSTTAGILPDAQTLFGGRVGTEMQAGGRVDFGFYIDPRQCAGYGFRFFGLGRDSSEFRVSSTDVPVLAIPFFDADAGANDALLVAFPGLRSGTVAITGTSSVISNDVYGRYLLCRDCNNRLDFITGWQYARIADNVEIRSQSTVTETGGTIPVGTVSTIVDEFDTRNEFHGAILGLQWQRNCSYWTTTWLARMSIGNMHETARIRGSTLITSPGQPDESLATGLCAASSNIGQRSRDEFTAITEVGFNVAYRFAPCTQLTVGYTFIYFSDILQPGTGIDTTIGDNGTTTRPQFAFRHSDYWVQGLSLGLSKEF